MTGGLTFDKNRVLKIFLLLVISIQFIYSQKVVNVLNSAERATVKNIRISVADSLGNKGFLPVSIVKGHQEGPVFTIIAGIHGFEYPPIMATQELMKEIDANQLSGTLIFVPVANPDSFYGWSPYVNPKDKINLNNAFPGKANGTITEQLAHKITTEIIPISDIFLDIHGGDAPEDLIPFACYYRNEEKSEQTALAKRLSEVAGFPYVVSYAYTISDDEPAKYAFKQAVQDGKTGLSLEAGKLGNVDKSDVKLIKTGVYNMLHETKMYLKETPKKEAFVELNGQSYIRSKKSGFYYTKWKAGETIEKGETVGYITDEFGVTLATYQAPLSGTVLYLHKSPPINVGNTIMCIGYRTEEK